MAFRPFPRFDAGRFLLMQDDAGAYLTAEASDLEVPPGAAPHGDAAGINLSGQPQGGGPPLDRAGFFFVRMDEAGWLYRHPLTGQEARVWND
jgi:hypothetical protein